jgi:hypothetical protein
VAEGGSALVDMSVAALFATTSHDSMRAVMLRVVTPSSILVDAQSSTRVSPSVFLRASDGGRE